MNGVWNKDPVKQSNLKTDIVLAYVPNETHAKLGTWLTTGYFPPTKFVRYSEKLR